MNTQQHLMEVIDREQARIGHDLHDGVGQLLSGIASLTESLEADLVGAQKQDAHRIYQLVREAIDQVRQLSHTLSPLSLQNRDLTASLMILAESVRMHFRRDCVTDLESGLSFMSPIAVEHLFRIAQESVNNAIRHGSPQKVTISLRRKGTSEGVLEIFNDGKSFDCMSSSASQGIGLQLMNYRASLIQASLQVVCPLQGGVMVSCHFPLHPK